METTTKGDMAIRKVGRLVNLLTPNPDEPLQVQVNQLKLYQTTERRWVIALVQVPFSVFDRVRKEKWFGLTTASIAAEEAVTWSFRSDLPVEIDLRLSDDALASLPESETAEDLLAALDGALDGGETDRPRQLSAWRYLKVLQANRRVDGTVVREGFRSRHGA